MLRPKAYAEASLSFKVVPRFDFRVRFCVAKERGDRQYDQDRHLLAPELGLFAVADGMGGGYAGDVAAEAAILALRGAVAESKSQKAADAYNQSSDIEHRRYLLKKLRYAVETANTAVRKLAFEQANERGMGTTLDAVWLARSSALVAHAGDSRAYLARARTVLQLTHDHVPVDALTAQGLLRPSPRLQSSALTNAIGLRDDVSVDTLFVELTRGDRLLLCSDGVHTELRSETELAEILRSGPIERAAEALVKRTGRTGRDNATALILEVGERFVTRPNPDRGVAAQDLEHAGQAPLLSDLPRPLVLQALAAAVEVEIKVGDNVPRVVANDLVAYIVLEGMVRCAGDRLVTTGALLFGESLVGVWKQGILPVAEEPCRVLRIRYDDFREVCADAGLGVELYRRLAAHLARS